tara:strand:+ start:540 stop:1133 length:594 start_codon:yes stop_codon:yes gene_type:complete
LIIFFEAPDTFVLGFFLGEFMPTEKGKALVAEMSEIFSNSSLIIAAEYRGIDVTQMTALRQQLRSKGARFKVIKNTFARIAADESGKSSLKDVMNGPIGFVVSDSDPAEAAKALVKYASENDLPINILGGMLDADLLDQSKIKSLATLPSKEELLSKMMGSMKSPVSGIVMVMNGPIRSLVNVLQRHVENNQENSAA